MRNEKNRKQVCTYESYKLIKADLLSDFEIVVLAYFSVLAMIPSLYNVRHDFA